MKEVFIPYQDQGIALEGFTAYPDTQKKHPLVLLCHAWRGRDEYICQKAKCLADLGYVGFALDVYGKGVIGNSREENTALKKPFIHDRHLLHRRLMKGFEVARNLPQADGEKVAIVGFGFGGLCALDLARSGADVLGVVSLYGHFDPLPKGLRKEIKAKLFLIHGNDDPIVPIQELLAFGKELKGVDWQAKIFGNTMHAFMVPGVNDPAYGTVHHPGSAKRAWQNVVGFLHEIFA